MFFDLRCILYLTLLLLLAACNQSSLQDKSLAKASQNSIFKSIQKKGEFVVLTRNAPTTYYEGNDGPAGIEYDLIQAFADHLHLYPRYVQKNSIAELLAALKNGEGVIAAAGLTKTEGRDNQFLFSTAYQTVQQQVVCRRDGVVPADTTELPGIKLWVASASSYVETLTKLKKALPTLSWHQTSEMDTEDLLEQVWKKKIDCTVADSNIVAINRRYFPELKIAFNLTDSQPLSWLMPLNARDLQHAVNHWFEQYKESGELKHVINRYYGFIKLFDYVDLRRFKKGMKKRLPKYINYFQQAGAKHDIPWTLLAAQSYQESHWRSRAKSPTGVRGIMMLTLSTARALGIHNRINPKNSIFGGARYLRQLNNRVPNAIAEPDRTWVALAAYNVGMGHVLDARRLAKRLGKDPNKWQSLKGVLPLLSKKKYYKTLRYGYARGDEPVQYVQRIRDFKDILDREYEQNNVKTALNNKTANSNI